MTYALTLILAGMVTGGGLYLLIRAAVPTNPQLAGALDRLSPDQSARRDATPVAPPSRRDVKERVGAVLDRRLSGRAEFTPPLKDLAVLNRTTRSYWGEKWSGAAVGFFGPIALQAINLIYPVIPIAIPAVVSIGLGTYFWFYPDITIKKEATQARREVVRAAISYCQQVAIQRRARAGATTALRQAAELSDGWMFVRIREELQRAQITGIPAWDGLDQLAERTGTPELAEVGDIMRLAGDSGAAVYDTLLARSKALNDALLAAEHRESLDRAESINGPVGLLPGILVLVILYPALLTLTTT